MDTQNGSPTPEQSPEEQEAAKRKVFLMALLCFGLPILTIILFKAAS